MYFFVEDDSWCSKFERIVHIHQINELSVPDMRNLISKLTIECFFKERFSGKKGKDICIYCMGHITQWLIDRYWDGGNVFSQMCSPNYIDSLSVIGPL